MFYIEDAKENFERADEKSKHFLRKFHVDFFI